MCCEWPSLGSKITTCCRNQWRVDYFEFNPVELDQFPLTCDWTFPIPPGNFVRKFQGNTVTTPHVLFPAQTALENALILPVIITKDIQGWFHQSQESNLVRSFIEEDFRRNVINFIEISKPNSLPGFRRRTIKRRPP